MDKEEMARRIEEWYGYRTGSIFVWIIIPQEDGSLHVKVSLWGGSVMDVKVTDDLIVGI